MSKTVCRLTRRCMWALWTLGVIAAVAAVARAADAPAEEAPRCARCDAVVAAERQVAVTDFAAGEEHLYCGVGCALRDMREMYPTSRAIAHDPFAGKEVRVIRTGAKWTAGPESAVFLYLPKPDADPQAGADADAVPGPRVAETCLAFPRQVEYIQYLATHPEVAVRGPRPLRLAGLLKALKEPGGSDAGQT